MQQLTNSRQQVVASAVLLFLCIYECMQQYSATIIIILHLPINKALFCWNWKPLAYNNNKKSGNTSCHIIDQNVVNPHKK